MYTNPFYLVDMITVLGPYLLGRYRPVTCNTRHNTRSEKNAQENFKLIGYLHVI